MDLQNLNFGKLKYYEDEGQGSFVAYYYDVCERDYYAYLSSLRNEGYSISDEYSLGECRVAVLKREDDMLLSNYYPHLHEATIVTEPNSTYLTFRDTPRGGKYEPLMTQIDLEDFGTSVVFRLTDGRFIIFDGGDVHEPDSDKLIKCLKEQSPYETPIIAAWIITHPHADHYECFIRTHEKYPSALNIEKFIYNFTDLNPKDFERIDELASKEDRLKLFDRYIHDTGADIYKAHTGQIYEFSGARLEILSSPDDVLLTPVTDINVLSLVIKMTIAGQVIMMCADAFMIKCNLAKRYGKYLKSDILQPPHHMFCGGDIETYDYIDPKVCVVPSFEEDVFGRISPYQKTSMKENRHLFYNLSVEEFFTGSTGNVVLKLPYTPRPHARENYLRTLESYRKRMGAESWFYSDITKDDCEFYFVNTTVENATVTIDLYADDLSGYVYAITLEVPRTCAIRVNILDTEAVEGDALYYNPHSLAKKGVSETGRFTAHIKSTIPIVVKGNRPADYFY